MTPDEYRNLSAKKEAELVPAWVEVSLDGLKWLLDGRVAYEYVPHLRQITARHVIGMTEDQWCSLHHPRKFLEARLRLPRRLQA